ncbi:hypothetical protein ACLX1H_005925 [Fusarium chlamydosporum]
MSKHLSDLGGSYSGQNEQLLEAFHTVTEHYGLCPNRAWAAAKHRLPKILPVGKAIKNRHQQAGHDMCTFDFCEASQRDFTAVKQRHECHECKGEECTDCEKTGCRQGYLFAKWTLERAAMNGMSTVWDLDGRSMLDPPAPYMAVSHVWSDGTGAGNQPDGKYNECLYNFFRGIAEKFQCEGIWWDTLCIPNGKEARSIAIGNIPSNYEDARITLVHDCFLRNWEWDADTACFAIVMSPWFSRGWTAVELARSRKVKVIFKGPDGPLIKDLDEEILAHDGAKEYHKDASNIIRDLRKGIASLDDLLTVMGPRHTSWPKDVATISALLVGAEPTGLQQDKYLSILKKFVETQPTGQLSYKHLFHNAATMTKVCWCPTNILNIPVSDAKQRGIIYPLRIESGWGLVGMWKVIGVTENLFQRCLWHGTHPMIKAKIQNALRCSSRYLLLAEPDVESPNKALLVQAFVKAGTLCGRYVGALYFHTQAWSEDTPDSCLMTVRLVSDSDIGDESPSDDIWSVAKRIAYAEASAKATQDSSQVHPKTIHKTRTDDFQDMDGRKEQHDTDSSRTPALILSIKSGDEKAVIHELSQSRQDLDATEPISLRTALHYAAWRGNHRLTNLLLKEGANCNVGDNRGQTPLHLAAERCNTVMVLDLLEHMAKATRCNFDATAKDGQTPLHRAVWGGSTATVRCLLDKSDLGKLDNAGHSPLHIAVKNGSSAIIALLLERSSPQHVNSRGPNGATPLHYAVMYAQGAAIKSLIEYGAATDLKDTSSGWTPLHVAVINGLKSAVEGLIAKGANPDVRGSSLGWTPLHLAAMLGNQEMASLLLNSGSQVQSRDNQVGWTPVHLAAANGHTELVALLLDKGIDINDKDKKGWTLLQFATRGMRTKLIKCLVQRGAKNDEQSSLPEWTPLHLAAVNGPHALLELLSKFPKSADRCIRNVRGRVMRHAARRGYDVIVKLLLTNRRGFQCQSSSMSLFNTNIENGVDRDNFEPVKTYKSSTYDIRPSALGPEDWHPLCLAVQNGHVKVASYLLGQNPDVLNPLASYTLLKLAIENEHLNMAGLLLNSGAEVNAKSELDRGNRAVHHAAKTGQLEMVMLLINKGSKLDCKNLFSQTPLSLAAEHGFLAVVQYLLQKGADPGTRDEYPWDTPLYFTLENGHTLIADELIENGANLAPFLHSHSPGFTLHDSVLRRLSERPNLFKFRDDEEYTPLMCAAERGDERVLEYLPASAELDSRNDCGETALMIAARRGLKNMVQQLMDKGADIESRNESGETALAIVARRGHEDVVQQLIDKGADIESRNESGETALAIAVRWGRKDVVQQLMDEGADIQSRNSNGEMLLAIAIREGHTNVVQQLIDKGADIESRNESGETALAIAVRRGRKDVVRQLVDKSANLEARTRTGDTPLFTAIESHNTDIARLLIESGADILAKNEAQVYS